MNLGEPRKHTTSPYVTGNSVLSIKYKEGVLMACDMLGAYGSTKRYKSVQRVFKVNETTIVGASGEISDFQYISNLLEELTTQDFCYDDGCTLSPKEIHAYLCRVLYNRRNKMDPLWNSLVVAGVDKSGESFIGSVGMLGTSYTDSHVATSFGNYLSRSVESPARPLAYSFTLSFEFSDHRWKMVDDKISEQHADPYFLLPCVCCVLSLAGHCSESFRGTT